MIYVNARFITQPLTGVQRYAFEVCIQMKKMDPTITFISSKNVIQKEWATVLNVQTFGLFSGHLWEQIELPLYLLKQKKGLLFSPCNTGPLLYSRQLLTLHDLAFKLFPTYNHFLFRSWYNFLIPKLCKKVKHIFTVSQTIKNEIITQYQTSREKISVTYNGISASMQISGDSPLQKEKMILTVGSINDRKNIHFLINGFLASQLAKEYKLVIIGKLNTIFKSTEINHSPQIIVIENADDSLLRDYYSKAELTCFLSHYEGFGIPILEALQFQCKVICSDIPAFRELFSGAVYFCSSKNSQELIKMLNHVNTYKVTSQNVVNLLNQKYNYLKSANVILNQLHHS